MAGRYGATMPKKRGKRRQEAKAKDKQVPAMKFLQMVGEGTMWAMRKVEEVTRPPAKPKEKEAVGGANEPSPGNAASPP